MKESVIDQFNELPPEIYGLSQVRFLEWVSINFDTDTPMIGQYSYEGTIVLDITDEEIDNAPLEFVKFLKANGAYFIEEQDRKDGFDDYCVIYSV